MSGEISFWCDCEPPSPSALQWVWSCSLDEILSLLGLVPPSWWESLHIAVVASESVDSALNENESELSSLVLAVLLQVLSDLYSLFDQMVEVLWDLWGEAGLFQDSEDFATSDALDLGDSVAISESDTDRRRHVTLLGKLHDLVNEILRLDSHPAWGGLSVGQASAGDTFTTRVHSSHFVFRRLFNNK